VKSFKYRTILGAVSGSIFLYLDSFYQDIYYMPNNMISFEVLD